jgi:cyclic pyranopterin phosphate synthase
MKEGMIDISSKKPAVRTASAAGTIHLKSSTIDLIKEGAVDKGDVLAVARVAAIQAVKCTPYNIPLCHSIPVEHVDVALNIDDEAVGVVVKVKGVAKTGVEMEALSGVAAALLTVWDMVKKYEKDELGQYTTTRIDGIRVLEKRKDSGGPL